jgi:hypothetical protein
MTREEVLAKLREQRAEFDGRLRAIPREALDRPVPGANHSPKQILAHVSAYERLIVERLRAARLGQGTEFDRDRVGWEAFNDRVWGETRDLPVDVVLLRSATDFLELLEEVAGLSDAELEDDQGMTAALDPAWLQGRPLWEAIAVDGFDHYPMHEAQLEAAGRGPA